VVTSLLTRMDRWFSAHRPDYYAQLNSGADAEQLRLFESRFSITLPADLCQLYRWRNGQSAACSESFQGNRLFCSLEEIAEAKDLLDGMIASDFEDPRYWRRGWIPFLHNGGGSYLCVDLVAQDSGAPGQLIEFWKTDDDRPVKFQSIEAWLDEFVRSMESGTLRLS